ncbi:hypothetical protein J004_01568, partial [Cryptococcus neoformans]
FYDKGLRFVFSTRSKVPWILKEDGSRFFDSDYKFVPGKDEVIRKGTRGYVVAYGEILYRALDAVDRLRKEGLDVGLINKSTLNVVDEDVIKEIGSTEFVFVAESLNRKTGLGSKFGTWLLERDLRPRYNYIGTSKEGCGGLGEQIGHQNLGSSDIALKLTPRQARWVELLSPSRFDIIYRPGKQASMPDTLSCRSDYHPCKGIIPDQEHNIVQALPRFFTCSAESLESLNISKEPSNSSNHSVKPLAGFDPAPRRFRDSKRSSPPF